jgi:hypothetical protein
MQFDAAWRYDSPGGLPRVVVNEFNSLVGIIASQGASRKRILEHFKSYFSNSYGSTSSTSSDVSWAESDLYTAMVAAGENAPLFIDAFYEACEALRGDPAIGLPDVARMNRILRLAEPTTDWDGVVCGPAGSGGPRRESCPSSGPRSSAATRPHSGRLTRLALPESGRSKRAEKWVGFVYMSVIEANVSPSRSRPRGDHSGSRHRKNAEIRSGNRNDQLGGA